MKNKDSTEVILMSNKPLPYEGIGSWTNLFSKYLSSSKYQIDYIICPNLNKIHLNSKIKYYHFNKDALANKLFNKFYVQFNLIRQIVKKDKKNKFIIHIIDNTGLVIAANKFLTNSSLRDRVYIQYSYHGFSIQSESLMKKINASCDEIILLTNLAYKDNLIRHTVLPKYVSVLNNGIDTQIFKPEKNQLSKKTTTFLWCSQDRPKKGLHIILEIWPKFHEQYPNTELKIVGTHKQYEGKGIKCLGRFPNHELPKIYQSSHVYLFPTLCHEGFGLTLAEALHSGCFCIASNIGGVPEVLNHGKYGWLIDEPHNSDSWLKAMLKYVIEKPESPKIPENLYNLDSWVLNLNKIISDAKKRLD